MGYAMLRFSRITDRLLRSARGLLQGGTHVLGAERVFSV